MTLFQQIITLFLTAATALVPLYIALVNAMQKRKYDHFQKSLEDTQEALKLVQANYVTLKEIVIAKDELIGEQKQTMDEQRDLINALQSIEAEVLVLRRENTEMKEHIKKLLAEKAIVEEKLNHYLKMNS